MEEEHQPESEASRTGILAALKASNVALGTN